jgi:hypothetical protein
MGRTEMRRGRFRLGLRAARDSLSIPETQITNWARHEPIDATNKQSLLWTMK